MQEGQHIALGDMFYDQENVEMSGLGVIKRPETLSEVISSRFAVSDCYETGN